ncbi:MAG: hypothetical protein Q9227_005884 [Pyrenula ochraceoflavens]
MCAAKNPDNGLPLDLVGEQIATSGHDRSPSLSSSQDESERELVEHFTRFRANPFEALREASLFVSGTGWRGYSNIIGQPSFYAGYTDDMKARVMRSPKLQHKISELADQRLLVEECDGLINPDPKLHESERRKRREELIAGLTEVTEEMTDKMICKMESNAFIRGAYYLCTQLLTRAYHQGIHVSGDEVQGLRAIAAQAAKEKKSLVFLPCHKSHVDYVSLQIVCYRLGITLPIVVAGDNLNFPLVGSFLQHAGAMWIRRSFDGDALYTCLVQSYIDTLLQNGYNLECFIEGGRSRTGKLLMPKFGILSFILDSVMSGSVEDCLICPVSTQYDKVIEVSSYVSELLGKPKSKENLSDFLSASSILSLKLGRVDVRFHKPWSLRSFINEQQNRFRSSPTLDNSLSMKSRILRTMGFSVLADINAASVVMPTALVGTVLLTLRGRGVGKSELVRRVDWLRARILAQGGRVAHFHGLSTDAVVDRALDVLGPGLVGMVEDLAEPTMYAVDRFELSFYRNMTIHLFISEALVAAALYTKVKQGGGPANQRIPGDALTEYVSFLSQLFRGEFIFEAGQGLAVNLKNTLTNLQSENVIEVNELPGGGTSVELNDIERQRGRENFDFYCFLIWPFVEAAWLGAVSLLSLTPPSKFAGSQWISMTKAQDTAQLFGKTLYHQGDLSYFEAVNKEALKNAYARFAEEGIILVTRNRESKAGPAVCLSLDWMPARDSDSGLIVPAGRLWDFIERIAACRREGKNRRDGATVSTRVLTLAGKVGVDLFKEPTANSASFEEPSIVVRKPVQRRSRL